MHPLSPVLLIAGASASRGLRFDRSGIRFVNNAGYRSHYDHRSRKSSWPLPRARTCDVLAGFAEDKGALVKEASEGDVFLCYCRFARRFVRAGIIVSVDLEYIWQGESVYCCTTVEGGESRSRTLTPGTGDRFIHWVDLEWRRHAA
jgi:hypothetical protein